MSTESTPPEEEPKATMAEEPTTEPELEEIVIREPIEIGGETWTKATLDPPSAGHLWNLPAAQSLPVREQALVGVSRVQGLPPEQRAVFLRELTGTDFSQFARVGAEMVAAYNVGQVETLELLAKRASDFGEKPYALELEEGFHGRKAGDRGQDTPHVLQLSFRPLKGADVWDTPAEGLTLGDIGDIVSRSTGYPVPFLRRMPLRDFGRALAVGNLFLQPFRPTGETA